ncbi:MAG: hypothetical protein QM755_14420 [Luteolibacter sp.]
MSDKGQTLLSEAMTLDLVERRWLAETLFESVEDAEGVAIATSRLEQLQSGEQHLIPFDEALGSLGR